MGGLTLIPFAYAVEEIPFSDLSPKHSNYEAILNLREKKIVEGYADNTFRPDQEVNRAEALKIILLGSKIKIDSTPLLNKDRLEEVDSTPLLNKDRLEEVDSTPLLNKEGLGEVTLPFPDTGSGAWYVPYLKKGLELGIVQGYSDGTFKPEQEVNRVEALKILLKTNQIDPPVGVVANPPYNDTPLGEWYLSYLLYAQTKNLIEPINTNEFKPALAVTRGILAEMMYRLNYLQERNLERFKRVEHGKASFYDNEFEGRRTALGDIFEQAKFSAAHLTYPLGTLVRVFNPITHDSVIVKINDRGHFGQYGRLLDLSKSAFEILGPLSRGLLEVGIEKVGFLLDFEKKVIPTDFFERILLTHSLPNVFQINETYLIEGEVFPATEEINVVYTDTTETSQRIFTSKIEQGHFAITVNFNQTGKFNLTIIPGKNGSGLSFPIYVIFPLLVEPEGEKLPVPTETTLVSNNGTTQFKWTAPPEANLFKITFTQSDSKAEQIVNDTKSWTATREFFQIFQPGELVWQVASAHSSTPFSLDRSTPWSIGKSSTFLVVPYETAFYNKEKIVLTTLPASIEPGQTLKLEGLGLVELDAMAGVIYPSGKTMLIKLLNSDQEPYIEKILPQHHFVLETPLPETGRYLVEINTEAGEAVFNYLFYPANYLPLLPCAQDLTANNWVQSKFDLVEIQKQILVWSNQLRKEQGLNELRVNNNLNKLAQLRSDDLVERQYFAHTTPEGGTVNELKGRFNLTTFVGENLAKDINYSLAWEGLIKSAVHRSNILNSDWDELGVGITLNQKRGIVLVQLFSINPLSLETIPLVKDELLTSLNRTRQNHTLAKLQFDATLQEQAQKWSEKMVQEKFTGFESPTRELLENLLKQALPVRKTFQINILTNLNLNNIIQAILDSPQAQDGRFKILGLGLTQDTDGLIKTTVIYGE